MTRRPYALRAWAPQVALVCDAALGNYQKRVLQQGCTVPQLMLYQSLAGMLALGAACVASGAPLTLPPPGGPGALLLPRVPGYTAYGGLGIEPTPTRN